MTAQPLDPETGQVPLTAVYSSPLLLGQAPRPDHVGEGCVSCYQGPSRMHTQFVDSNSDSAVLLEDKMGSESAQQVFHLVICLHDLVQANNSSEVVSEVDNIKRRKSRWQRPYHGPTIMTS
jgi:hypothetical protein